MILWILLAALTNLTNVASYHPIHVTSVKLHEKLCNKVGRNPFFTPKLVLGKPWRVHYVWHIRMSRKTCIDITFKKVTAWTLERFRKDMTDYMETQPAWDSAMLFMKIGSFNNQILLFPASGAPVGRVLGARNISRDRTFTRPMRGFSMVQFQLKLLRGGKYLVLVNCQTGLVMLAARAGEPPFAPEIAAAAAEIGIGEGRPSCVKSE